ncbi:MAG: hypothetical protein JWN99_2471, partial [Ilumatobacteraceae bacterium]|nr:hypothetical protein [Ilumatobacteraceae bacterium]
ASASDLVFIGHVADGVLQVWRGSADRVAQVSEFDAPVPAGGLVALARFHDEWHLFARNERGRSSHLVSTDLCRWTAFPNLVTSFPAFAVSGVAVRENDLLLAGRVFVDNTAFGWGLLRSDGRVFEARPVPLPLATQLGVVGPTVDGAGDTVLLLDSGHNRTVARSTGMGWSLQMLVPDVTPTASFTDVDDLWLVGYDNVEGVPSMAKIDQSELVPLHDPAFGRVRSATVHHDHVVLAHEC